MPKVSDVSRYSLEHVPVTNHIGTVNRPEYQMVQNLPNSPQNGILLSVRAQPRAPKELRTPGDPRFVAALDYHEENETGAYDAAEVKPSTVVAMTGHSIV